MIAAAGMAASLGCAADTCCAAARAGVVRLAELQNLNFAGYQEFGRETEDGFPPVVGHAAPLEYGYAGEARLMVLGALALRDLLEQRPDLSGGAAGTALYLNLSDRYVEQVYAKSSEADGPPKPEPLGGSRLMEFMLSRAGLAFPQRNCRVHRAGRVGFVRALSDALRAIAQGSFERCIVGAVDCCFDPGFLVAAAGLRILRTGDNPVGFLPGEAACFLLLERPGPAIRGLCVCGVAFGEGAPGEFDETPSTGECLADTVAAAIESSRPKIPEVGYWLGDLNGTERRAIDWGHAIVRLQGRYRFPNLRTWIPAASFGEIGAASGAVGIAMVLKAHERGYAPGATSVVWLSAESGHRAAIVLSSDPAARG